MSNVTPLNTLFIITITNHRQSHTLMLDPPQIPLMYFSNMSKCYLVSGSDLAPKDPLIKTDDVYPVHSVSDVMDRVIFVIGLVDKSLRGGEIRIAGMISWNKSLF